MIDSIKSFFGISKYSIRCDICNEKLILQEESSKHWLKYFYYAVVDDEYIENCFFYICKNNCQESFVQFKNGSKLIRYTEYNIKDIQLLIDYTKGPGAKLSIKKHYPNNLYEVIEVPKEILDTSFLDIKDHNIDKLYFKLQTYLLLK